MAGNYWQPRNIGSFSWSNSLPLCLFLRSTKSWPENPLPISFSRWCSVARFCSILLFKAYTKLWNYVLLHEVVNFVNQKCLGITFGTHLYQYVIKYNMYFAPYFPKHTNTFIFSNMIASDLTILAALAVMVDGKVHCLWFAKCKCSEDIVYTNYHIYQHALAVGVSRFKALWRVVKVSREYISSQAPSSILVQFKHKSFCSARVKTSHSHKP